MNTNANAGLLAKLANELPALARQMASSDVSIRAAGLMRLNELAALLAPYWGVRRPQPTATRRSVRYLSLSKGKARPGFVALAIKQDD